MSVTVLPRTAWTSTAPGFPRYSGRRITPARVTHLRLHYPGDGNHTRAHYTRAQSEQALRNYRAFHINGRGWADIGYPLAVDQSGRAWVAAGTSHAAAHSATGVRPNENWHSLAILLIIGNNEAPSAAMIATVNAIWAGLVTGTLGLGQFPNMTRVTAHNDVPGASTRCAGPQVDQLLRAGAFRASGVSTTTPIPEDDMPLTNDDIRRIWTHTHPSQMSTTDMRGFMVSTYRKLAEVEAAQAGLIGAIAALGRGEPFDEAKLLEGVRKAAQQGVAEAVDSIDTTVTITRKED